MSPRAKRSTAKLAHLSVIDTPCNSAFGSGFAGGLLGKLGVTIG